MVQVVTGDSQEEVIIFRDKQTDMHHNIYIIMRKRTSWTKSIISTKLSPIATIFGCISDLYSSFDFIWRSFPFSPNPPFARGHVNNLQSQTLLDKMLNKMQNSEPMYMPRDLLQKVWGSDLPNRNKGVGPLMYLPRLGYPVQRRWWSSSRLKEAICSTIIMREENSWLKTTNKKKNALFYTFCSFGF